jgi:hypothetical protein
VNGTVGIVTAPRRRLLVVRKFTIERDKTDEIEVIATPARLHELDISRSSTGTATSNPTPALSSNGSIARNRKREPNRTPAPQRALDATKAHITDVPLGWVNGDVRMS